MASKAKKAKRAQRREAKEGYKASLEMVRISSRKLKLLADLVRNKSVDAAINDLRFTTKKLSAELIKLIRSAVSNAAQDSTVNLDKLYIKKVYLNQKPTMRRFMPRARGGAASILKRSSSIAVVLDQKI